jgi:hypothetical protein
MKEEKKEQPTFDAQAVYLSLVNNDAEEVTILRTNKKYKIRWLKNGQIEKLSRLLLHKKDLDDNTTTGSDILDSILEDSKIACKAAAIIILDGYWKIKLRYWLLWRWFYYVKQYDNIQLEPILESGKKKVPLIQFFRTITSLTEARDSLMRMRAKEVETILLAQNTGQPSATASSVSGS